MASLVFLLLSSSLILSLLFISVSADDFSTILDKQTNINDAMAITLLQVTFIGLLTWTGDPCYPSAWSWVSCSSDQVRPRITGLYLGDFGLVGYLPDISIMDALEIIDLHKNSLTGEIPAFLGTFPKLTELNLADNDFIGSVPSTISKNTNIKLDVTGNPQLCKIGTCENTGSTSDTTPGTQTSPGTGSSATGNGRMKKKNNVAAIVLGTILSIAFVFCIVGYLAIRDHQMKNAAAMKASDSTAAGQNEMDVAAGKSEVPLQAMPITPSSNTSVPGILQGDQGQEAYQEVPPYFPITNDVDYQDVPSYYPITNDVETGNPTMKSETRH